MGIEDWKYFPDMETTKSENSRMSIFRLPDPLVSRLKPYLLFHFEETLGQPKIYNTY